MTDVGRTSRRIVVGVDGSEASVEALRWALGQAELTGGVVEALTAWDIPTSYGIAPTVWDDEDLAGAARQSLDAAVEQASPAHPAVSVERRVVQGHPVTVLLDQAKTGELLVLGSHGHGAFVGALLGSVVQRCIERAACPVVVVRREA